MQEPREPGVTSGPGDARRDWEARVGRASDETAGIRLPDLAAPSGLRASEGRGQVTLSWDPVEGAAGYLLYRAPALEGAYEPIVVGEPLVRAIPDTCLTDTSGEPRVTAWYRVASAANVEDDGQPLSDPVSATPRLDGDGRVTIRVDAGRTVGPLHRPWRPMIGSEHLSLMTYGEGPGGVAIGPDLARALRTVHDELGVEAVRAHAILHDELGGYREVNGEPRYDFARIGAIYDQVLEIGLRPVVEISFMPRDLASDPSKTVFEYHAIVSPPRDYERWGELIGALVRYLVDRYGRHEVRRWGFEVWNEANLDVFWSGTRDEYLRLYDVTVAAVKSVDPELPVGGPATAAVGWVDELLDHVRSSGAAIDFLSTHSYGNVPLDLRPICRRHGYPGLRLWWTEWGAHAGHFRALNDTVWSAGFLVRGMKSSMGRLEALAYWVASDQFEELGWPTGLLHGGFGLLSVGNLRKPRYWAMWMLEQLGPDRLDVRLDGDAAGDMVDAVAAVDDSGRIRVLAWNCTVDRFKAPGDPLLDRVATVHITGVVAPAYRVRHRRVDAAHSNLGATWEGLRADDWPTAEQWTALRAADRLEDLEPERILPSDGGSLELQLDLPMPAISLLELTPV
jgi:xylan 1,4-beta-xylosidase